MNYGISHQWHTQLLQAMLCRKYHDENLILIQENKTTFRYHFPDQQKVDKMLQSSMFSMLNEQENVVSVYFPNIPLQCILLHTSAIRYVLSVRIIEHYQKKGICYQPIVYITDNVELFDGTQVFATYTDNESRDIKHALQVSTQDDLTLIL